MQYRVSGIVMMGALAIAALGLYLVKYWVQDVQLEVNQVEVALDKERESLHLLNAEWAYLNRPDRLQKLSEKYLQLTPVTSAQFVSFSALPDMVVDTQNHAQEVNAEVPLGSEFYAPVGNR